MSERLLDRGVPGLRARARRLCAPCKGAPRPSAPSQGANKQRSSVIDHSDGDVITNGPDASLRAMHEASGGRELENTGPALSGQVQAYACHTAHTRHGVAKPIPVKEVMRAVLHASRYSASQRLGRSASCSSYQA